MLIYVSTLLLIQFSFNPTNLRQMNKPQIKQCRMISSSGSFQLLHKTQLTQPGMFSTYLFLISEINRAIKTGVKKTRATLNK